ncbi:MAG: hypothetical protein KDC95_07630 [Planctomycetes bacterium]|nr:hypothetical protein [Planctomycetota bacterium]
MNVHHNRTRRLLGAAVVALPFALAACGGGTKGDPNNPGPFQVQVVTNGFGQVFPYRITELDAFGVPGTKTVDVTDKTVLEANMTSTNGVLPPAVFGTTAQLPGGNPGNQYLLVKFTHELDVETVLSSLVADQQNSGLTGAISILQYDPATEEQKFVKGRAYVGGYAFLDDPSTPQLDLKLTKVVAADKDGNVSIVDSRGNGFPLGFTGDEDLVTPKSFVFVPDDDNVLTTFETFPTGKVIRLRVTSAVRDFRGKIVREEVGTATTVGTDSVPPRVLGYTTTPAIEPGNGQLGVDPTTTIRVTFSKPVQPRDVGEFFNASLLTPALRGLILNVTIADVTFPVGYYADPLSMSDFMTYTVRPSYALPGDANVQFGVNNSINSLPGVALASPLTTTFRTGKGPGIINAPVAPEAIYVGRRGTNASLSVIDLNGFGQGTGDIGDTYPSNWKNNPNLRANDNVYPPLRPGRTNLDAGGEGFLALVRDTNLSSRLIDDSIVSGVDEIHIGQPLDKIYNNENINPNTTRANQVNPTTGVNQNAWGNSISIAPHPNPPRLVYPVQNAAQGIFGEEPSTQTSTAQPGVPPGVVLTFHPPVGPCRNTPHNLLVNGDPFSTDPTKLGIYGGIEMGIFFGPQPPPPTPQPPTPFCLYQSRQQIGHFLYVLDREKKQVLCVNSNRMTVLETLRFSDPVEIAMSPNLTRLAVSNFSSNTVTFVDTDPASQTFNTIIAETKVGEGPGPMAWQPEGEELLVVNVTENSITLLGGGDLKERKSVSGFINNPVDICVTPRQSGFGWQTGIYFAYILNANGSVAIFESGPDGVNGIGYDNVVGIPEGASFRRARKLMPDVKSFNSAVWVAHSDSSGLGQVSHLELTSSFIGVLPISPNSGGFILPPTFRQREWTVNGRIGGTTQQSRLSGNTPVDLAVDDCYNFGAAGDLVSNQISNLRYAPHSGKGMIKGGATASFPRLLFVACGDSGTVDAFEIDTGNLVKTIEVPGVATLSHYWRQ